jgi:hypothetical protein
MEVTIEHKLGIIEAKKRIMGLLTSMKQIYKEQISVEKEIWKEDDAEFAFIIMGLKVNGTMKITEKEVFINGTLPVFALPFKRQIESKLKVEAEKILQ